jgi:hypothetical protein
MLNNLANIKLYITAAICNRIIAWAPPGTNDVCHCLGAQLAQRTPTGVTVTHFWHIAFAQAEQERLASAHLCLLRRCILVPEYLYAYSTHFTGSTNDSKASGVGNFYHYSGKLRH